MNRFSEAAVSDLRALIASSDPWVEDVREEPRTKTAEPGEADRAEVVEFELIYHLTKLQFCCRYAETFKRSGSDI